MRYSYWLQARVTYRELAPGELVPASAGDRGPPSLPEGELMPDDLPPDDGVEEAAQRPLLGGIAGGKAGNGVTAATTATVRIPLHIWPLRPEGSSCGLGSLINGLSSQVASVASTQPHATQQQQQLLLQQQQHNPDEAITIKCWEIGPGTQVEDAISHIAKLAAVPAALRPSSPGKRPTTRQHMQPGLQSQANGAAAGQIDDARSEISHDETEQQQQHDSQRKQPVSASPPSQPLPSQPLPGPGSGSLRRPSLSRAVTADSERSLVMAASAALEGGVAAVRSYALRIGAHPLVRVSLHLPLEGALQPGATVGVTLEFARPGAQCQLHNVAAAARAGATGSGSLQAPTPRCMQVLVLLETEETVEAPWRPKGAGGIRRVWDEHSEVTGDTVSTHLLFTLPPDAAPSFATPLVQLRWLLRFQFMASTLPVGVLPGTSPLAGKIDTLSWTLPLAVCSPRA